MKVSEIYYQYQEWCWDFTLMLNFEKGELKMNDIIHKIIQMCGSITEITEELTRVCYRKNTFLVNKSGTVILCAIAGNINPRYKYALYKGQPYSFRTVGVRKRLDGDHQVTITGKAGVRLELARLMLYAFGHFVKDEENPQAWVAKHKDSNRLNCCIDNLVWQSKTDFRTEQEIKKKGFCIKVEAEKNGINTKTLTERLRYRTRLEECINFKKINRNYDIPLEELKKISVETGIHIGTLCSRYNDGDRGERLRRPCLGRGRFRKKISKSTYQNN